MLILNDKLRVNQRQQSATREAIRTVEFLRNKALRLSHGRAQRRPV